MNIGYFRVSMEGETIQDLDRQVEVVLDHYKPTDVIILKERGSAYNLNKLHKRTEFMELLNLLFDIEHTTLKDLFTQNIQRTEINLYIYDYSRLMRNIELSILFGLLCSHFNITVHCWKDKSVFKLQERIPGERIIKYIMLAMNAFSSEDYSHQTSMNIKKSRKIEKGMSVSSYGKKWGGSFKYLDHTKEEPHMVDIKTTREINKKLLSLIKDYSYRDAGKMLSKKYNIKPPSPSHITKLVQLSSVATPK